MKTRIIIISIIAVIAAAGFAIGANEKADAPAAKSSELKTELEKVSYIIGTNIGASFKQSGLNDLEFDAFFKGIKDVLAGNEPALSREEMQSIMQSFSEKMRAKQQEERDEMSKKNIEEGKAFLKENAKKEGVVTLPSGLQYKVIEKGTGPKLKETDIFKAYYKGTFIDGEVFDSKIKGKDEPLQMPVGKVIPGWVEALKRMPIGSKWKLFIPGDLAYGPEGRGKMANATLIFEVELVGEGEMPKREALPQRPDIR